MSAKTHLQISLWDLVGIANLYSSLKGRQHATHETNLSNQLRPRRYTTQIRCTQSGIEYALLSMLMSPRAFVEADYQELKELTALLENYNRLMATFDQLASPTDSSAQADGGN